MRINRVLRYGVAFSDLWDLDWSFHAGMIPLMLAHFCFVWHVGELCWTAKVAWKMCIAE